MAIQVTVMSIDFDSFEEPITKVFDKNEISVGRKEGNDLILNRPEVSSFHAKLFIKPNGKKGSPPKLYITDLGSSNGTMLERDNLKPETEVRVEPNQRLIIGSYLLKPVIIGGMIDEKDAPAQPKPAPTRLTHSPRETVMVKREDLFALDETAAPAEESIIEDKETVRRNKFDRIEETPVEPEPALAELFTEEEPIAAPIENEATRTHIVSAVPPIVNLHIDADSVLDLHFEATELFRLAGRVTHGGSGLAGVRIDGGDLGVLETDADGNFALADIADSTSYRLVLSKAGYLLEPSVLSGSLSADSTLHISASKLHQLSGKIQHRGQPLSGVRVDAGALGSATTDADGLFTFRDVKEGTPFKLSVARERFLFDSAEAQGTVDRDIALNFNAKKLITVAGRVLHKGKPLAGVEIECVNLGKATTDSQGRYTFENVPEGADYTFTAQKAGFRFSHTRQLQ